MGPTAFAKKYKKYSKELKLQAVLDYLAGQSSIDDICKKYKIRSKGKLQIWIKKYSSHKELKSSRTVINVCCAFARKLNIKSTIKYSNNGCTRQVANPQYIAENILNREFTAKVPNRKLVNAGITQSMSRVAKCIDNGPMEGFWVILKRERYYGKRFTNKDTLVKIIEDYIDYYNKRLQINLGVLTPMEKHEIYLQVA